MSIVENLMSRRRRRDSEAEPTRPEIQHWSKAPGVIAAAEARREAEAARDALMAELTAAEARVMELETRAGTTGLSDDELEELKEAEQCVVTATRELKWKRFAAQRLATELKAANEVAQSELTAKVVRQLGIDQQRIFDLASALLEANRELSITIRAGEAAGVTVRHVIEQHWPVIDADMLKTWRRRARWLSGNDASGPDTKVFAEVIVRRTGGAPIQGVMLGERCWIPKTDIPRLLKARAIDVIGTPEGVFVPPAPPKPDGLGDVWVKFNQRHVMQMPGGAWRAWQEEELARVPHQIGWEAVVDQVAEYTRPGPMIPEC
jgi:hypothetical protein